MDTGRLRLPVPRLWFLTSPSGITIRSRNHPASRHAGTSSRLLPALRHIEPAGPDGQTRRPHDQPTGADVTGQGTRSPIVCTRHCLMRDDEMTGKTERPL
jgi:hypothetical protein